MAEAEWVEDLVGDEWEDYCRPLLQHRHNPVDVQAVPAANGDLGIDYWIRGAGDIYQCYGTEKGDAHAERLRLQKEKLGREVLKLKRKHERIASLITPALCSRYIFLLPKYDDKELLNYAAIKGKEIRSAELSFCADDFEICVQNIKDFAFERAAMLQAGLRHPHLIQVEPADNDVHDWVTNNGELAKTIREKVEAVYPKDSPEKLDKCVQNVVGDYLRGEDAMSSLKVQFGDLYEQTRKVVTRRRARLRSLGGAGAVVPREALIAEYDGLVSAFGMPEVGMDENDANTLAGGTVATWLADCTLDPR